MTRKPKPAQGFTPEEFEAVVSMIRSDASLRADIETITGQKLDGKTPRQLFDLFRAINTAAEVQNAVVRYGRARQAVRQTRIELQDLPPADMPPTQAAYVQGLQERLDVVKAENQQLRAANAALRAGTVHPIPARTIKGEVAS
ncbi:hypothetical protein FLW53_09380 [Microbispora sp. SCL1-1]|uniref:hypothetical protein n=1 Tax=unclassified Microbispora TaxID=2614687 RepID=UPI001159B818|nr:MULTISPECIES: hypothetical protein [unclassified Microbispora]NJP24413.1 hypothetical protein [Microbispora sp. CL1-1]TQS14564.1 hypothetical protein FLW53_09380 [Microbispora sp. SCL1-1]